MVPLTVVHKLLVGPAASPVIPLTLCEVRAVAAASPPWSGVDSLQSATLHCALNSLLLPMDSLCPLALERRAILVVLCVHMIISSMVPLNRRVSLLMLWIGLWHQYVKVV